MIEFCSRKRMVLAIILLFSLTVVTLIVEGMWSAKHKIGEVNAETEAEEECGSKPTKMVEECKPCTNYEMKMEAKFCTKTGYKETIQCGQNTTYIKRSCKLDPRVQERQFWMLELGSLAIGLLSFSIVKYRQGKLDQQLLDKVNRQIAA